MELTLSVEMKIDELSYEKGVDRVPEAVRKKESSRKTPSNVPTSQEKAFETRKVQIPISRDSELSSHFHNRIWVR